MAFMTGIFIRHNFFSGKNGRSWYYRTLFSWHQFLTDLSHHHFDFGTFWVTFRWIVGQIMMAKWSFVWACSFDLSYSFMSNQVHMSPVTLHILRFLWRNGKLPLKSCFCSDLKRFTKFLLVRSFFPQDLYDESKEYKRSRVHSCLKLFIYEPNSGIWGKSQFK